MKFTKASTIAALQSLAALLALPQGLLAQSVPAHNCTGPNSVHAIMARGEGPGDNLNILVSTLGVIKQRIPGSDGLGLPFDHAGSFKQEVVFQGSELLITYIEDYIASCPSSKLVLVGYSEGAVVTMNALCGTSSAAMIPSAPIDSKYAKNVAGVILFGDETRVPNQPWDYGNCTDGIGDFPRLDPAACDPFGPSIRSYCDYYDSECCTLGPYNGNLGHHGYDARYNQDAVSFIIERLKTMG